MQNMYFGEDAQLEDPKTPDPSTIALRAKLQAECRHYKGTSTMWPIRSCINYPRFILKGAVYDMMVQLLRILLRILFWRSHRRAPVPSPDPALENIL